MTEHLVSTRVSVLSIDDLMHELRQPLSTIESLAYYLELTSPNEHVLQHAQRIQEMVMQASSIIERHCASDLKAKAASSNVS